MLIPSEPAIITNICHFSCFYPFAETGDFSVKIHAGHFSVASCNSNIYPGLLSLPVDNLFMMHFHYMKSFTSKIIGDCHYSKSIYPLKTDSIR